MMDQKQIKPSKKIWTSLRTVYGLMALVTFGFGSCQTLRQQRLFPLLSWVIFPNSACLASNSTTGTCLSPSSCNVLKGNNTGTKCATGYGVCCIFLNSCGSTLTQNNSYFLNPGYPNSSTNQETCIAMVEKQNRNVAQLRLDFEEFDINGVTNRVCEQDAFQVLGQDTNSIVPSLCGINTGQHIYVDVGSVRGPMILAMITTGPGTRRWRIRATQIEQNSPSQAPSGCLQYYTGPMGNVASFNFDSATMGGQSNILRNLNYAICIRRENGYCGIQYMADPGSFSLEGPASISVDAQCETSGNNMADSLYIPFNRYCGGSGATTPTTFTSTLAGLFRLIFKTEDGTPSASHRGFNLDYQQTLCNSVITSQIESDS